MTVEWVLVVEDEVLVAHDTKSLLEKAGFAHIALAGNLPDAEAFLAKETPALAILDIDIRGCLVFPFVARLTQQSVPIVFLTGGDKSAIPAEWQGHPALSKPLSLASLTAALAAVGLPFGRRSLPP